MVRVKKSVQQLVLKMIIYEWNLERNIINPYPFLNSQGKARGMQIQLDFWAGYSHKVVMEHLQHAWSIWTWHKSAFCHGSPPYQSAREYIF